MCLRDGFLIGPSAVPVTPGVAWSLTQDEHVGATAGFQHPLGTSMGNSVTGLTSA